MLNVSGKRELRTIRLYKGALPLLNVLHSDAMDRYMELTGGHRFSSSPAHIERNHRVAEVLAVCQMAGVEFHPCSLPVLQKQQILHTVPSSPCFYIARSFKSLDNSEMNKTRFTRLAGALFTQDVCFAVYNTRSSVMKWGGMGEFKTIQHLSELARMNADLPGADRALLLGNQMDVALQTVCESEKSCRTEFSFDRIYPHIHFIPMDRQGVRLLRILTLPRWREELLSAIFPTEWLPGSPGAVEFDARHGNTFILSHLDGDLARLIRLRQSLLHTDLRFEVLCFPWQTALLREYLGDRVSLREVGMDALEEALGIDERTEGAQCEI